MVVSDFVNDTIKCLTLPAALIGTIQAVIWFTLSLVSILYYNDIIEISTSVSQTSYGYIIYWLYLRSSSDSTFEVLTITPKEFNIFMYLYLVLSFLWLLTSICMIWVVIRKKWNNISQLLICWSTVTICIAILDVSFMGVLASDLHIAPDIFAPTTTTATTTIPSTTPPVEPESEVQNTGARNLALPEPNALSEQDIYTAIGIVMSLAARGYVLWMLNVIFSIILIVTVTRLKKSIRPSLMQRPIIDAFERGAAPFSIYDQVEIDKSFQNEAFTSDEPNIFSPRTNDPYYNSFNNNASKNPLSNSNRSSLIYGQNPTHPLHINKPIKIPPAHQQNGKLAKIGKSGGRRSPPQAVPSPTVPHTSNMPYIPEPDYTPPGSPKFKPKGVLRPGSKYEY